eukprot:CAMPEP_0184458120 /NCGR_PEP_ID=MMETSP0740-20130409/32170_1 /TAXON_ID=385413 /ORGANISM="Thalassiosira miniscula, Strain CCMP1093" /LENGTH=61 /DNA_ID=CAMNT_0026830687 /DNA_START=352 /DNA_END=534 /DNA_ORIENTATION=+
MNKRNHINGDESEVPTDCHTFMVNLQSVYVQSVNYVYNIIAYMSLSIGQTVRHQGYSMKKN